MLLHRKEVFMIGVIRFIFAVIWFALALGAAGTLLDATVFMKDQAAKSYQRGGVSHKWWNDKLNK